MTVQVDQSLIDSLHLPPPHDHANGPTGWTVNPHAAFLTIDATLSIPLVIAFCAGCSEVILFSAALLVSKMPASPLNKLVLPAGARSAATAPADASDGSPQQPD